MNKEHIVVYSSDGNDYQRAKISVASVKKNLPDAKFIFLNHKGKLPLKEAGDYTVIDPTQTLCRLGIEASGWNNQWPFATLFRTSLPLLKELQEINRVLYLDTDTIVRNSDIATLFEQPTGLYEVHGVPDIERLQGRKADLIMSMLTGTAADALREKLWKKKNSIAHSYINAGVSVWDLDVIRANGIEWYEQRLKWFFEAAQRGRCHYADQDFINAMIDVNPGLNRKFNWITGDTGPWGCINHCVGSVRGSNQYHPVAETALEGFCFHPYVKTDIPLDSIVSRGENTQDPKSISICQVANYTAFEKLMQAMDDMLATKPEFGITGTGYKQGSMVKSAVRLNFGNPDILDGDRWTVKRFCTKESTVYSRW